MRANSTKFAAVAALFILSINISSATQFLSKNGMIEKDFDDDVFLFGNNIKFEGQIDGDLFAFCQEIVQSDSITQSLTGFANSVQCLGPIGGSLRAFANMVTCNAPVERNLLLFCNSATIGPQAVIGKSADMVCGSVVFQGTVAGNVKIKTHNAMISGTINGDLHFEGDSLILNPGCVIGGNLDYKSPRQASIAPGVKIGGDTDWEKSEEKQESGPTTFIGKLGNVTRWLISVRGYFLMNLVVSTIVFILALIKFPVWLSLIFLWMTMVICGNIFILFTRRKASATEKILRTRLMPSMGLGLVILFLTPLVSAGLMLTILGAPLGILMLMLFGIALFAGLVYFSLYAGRLICRIFNPAADSTPGNFCFTIGIVILVALAYVPYIGYIITLIILMAGLGAIAQSFSHGASIEPAGAAQSQHQ